MVARLRDAGAVFVGKTNLHEFALGTTNEESAYGPVHHPLDASLDKLRAQISYQGQYHQLAVSPQSGIPVMHIARQNELTL